MFSYLLRQLFNSLGIFFRTIRAFFTRKLVGLWAYLRRITNFTRQATRVATTSFQGAATAIKKPTKREDYIETQRLFISKSFLVMLAIALVALGLLFYFLVWPFLLSHFFVAKFYQGDAKLTDWSGRVIVYYDEEKEHPMYRGTLEEGLLQGKGEEYDPEGLLTYQGSFVDGVRSGEGSLYEGGVLVYEGQFSQGAANGQGTAYADGIKCYQGAFVDGLYEGEGTEYYPDGTRRYVGSFAQGLYEGEGVQYSEDGQMYYKGSFAAGAYEGSGTVYLEKDSCIQAEFTQGETNGTIQWYRKGKMWYDGSADHLTPDGFGTLYGENGKAVYAGEFDQGTLDGAWMLTLTATELRQAFGEARLTETDGSGGFLIVNEDLGLTALCSYQQEGVEAQAYRLWFAPAQDSLCAALLPWASGSDAQLWAVTGRETPPQESVLQGALLQPDGSVGGDWYQRQYSYEDYVCLLLSPQAADAPTQICWSRDMSQASGQPVDSGASQAQERLDELLSALEGAGVSAGSGGGSSQASQEEVGRLLGLMLSAQDGEDLMDALIDHYTYDRMADSLEASQPLLQQLLADAQTQLQRGEGSQEAVDQAQGNLDSLDRRLAQYRTAQKQAALTVEELAKLSPDDFDLQAALVCFDPVELNVSALCTAAAEYAGQVAAGRYEVDAAALERELKSDVLELGLSYESVRSAQEAAKAAAANVDTVTQQYAKGTADRAALYGAQCARDEAAAALVQSLGTFAHQANALNTLSGGWVAREYGWMADTFSSLFQGEILRGQQAAQQAQEELDQKVEQAAQEILEQQQQQQAASGGAQGQTPAPDQSGAAG